MGSIEVLQCVFILSLSPLIGVGAVQPRKSGGKYKREEEEVEAGLGADTKKRATKACKGER